jgi:ABC-type nitrate/sulfonate/bicarbonate transport system permease component
MKTITPIARAALPLLLAVSVWYAVALAIESYRGVAFPTPLETAARLTELFAGDTLSRHTLYRHLGDSLLRWCAGFGLAAVAGVVAGLAAGGLQPVRTVLSPLFHTLQLIPGLAWIPVALLLFGIGEAATVFMIAMTAFPPVAISVMDGVRRIDTTYVRAARMLGAGTRTLFLHVLLPGSLPALVTGLRLGLGSGWRVLVAAEMVVGTGTGLGYSISEARWTLDYTSAFACVAVICGVGLAVERLLFTPLEARTYLRWALNRDAA